MNLRNVGRASGRSCGRASGRARKCGRSRLGGRMREGNGPSGGRRAGGEMEVPSEIPQSAVKSQTPPTEAVGSTGTWSTRAVAAHAVDSMALLGARGATADAEARSVEIKDARPDHVLHRETSQQDRGAGAMSPDPSVVSLGDFLDLPVGPLSAVCSAGDEGASREALLRGAWSPGRSAPLVRDIATDRTVLTGYATPAVHVVPHHGRYAVAAEPARDEALSEAEPTFDEEYAGFLEWREMQRRARQNAPTQQGGSGYGASAPTQTVGRGASAPTLDGIVGLGEFPDLPFSAPQDAPVNFGHDNLPLIFAANRGRCSSLAYLDATRAVKLRRCTIADLTDQ